MSEARRRRINRIKRVIIVLLALAIAVPTCLCIFFMFRYREVSSRLDKARDLLREAQEEAENNRRELALLSAVSGVEDDRDSVSADSLPASESGVAPGQDETDDEVSAFDSEVLSVRDRDEDIDTYDIYLTFDDGPSENTDEILNILREYDVRATFFVNGRTDEESLQLYERIASAGHTLGMHSYSHRYSVVYSSPASFTEDMQRIRELIVEAAGIDPVFYRFPGGSSNHVASASQMHEYIDILHENGIEYVDWNIDSRDASGGGIEADDIVSNVFRDFGKYRVNVVLLHDGAGHSETVRALPGIIERARNMGARLLPVTDESLSVKHVE